MDGAEVAVYVRESFSGAFYLVFQSVVRCIISFTGLGTKWLVSGVYFHPKLGHNVLNEVVELFECCHVVIGDMNRQYPLWGTNVDGVSK